MGRVAGKGRGTRPKSGTCNMFLGRERIMHLGLTKVGYKRLINLRRKA